MFSSLKGCHRGSVVNGDLWWRSSSQIAADVLKSIYCQKGACSAETGARLLERARAPRLKPTEAELIGAAPPKPPRDQAG